MAKHRLINSNDYDRYNQGSPIVIINKVAHKHGVYGKDSPYGGESWTEVQDKRKKSKNVIVPNTKSVMFNDLTSRFY
jgi:hypothetical protein